MSGGDTFSPWQVKRAGIKAPSLNAVLPMRKLECADPDDGWPHDTTGISNMGDSSMMHTPSTSLQEQRPGQEAFCEAKAVRNLQDARIIYYPFHSMRSQKLALSKRIPQKVFDSIPRGVEFLKFHPGWDELRVRNTFQAIST